MNLLNTYPASTEDDLLHGRFTAYVVAAVRNNKIRYLTKKNRNRMELSLDDLLEHVTETDLQADPSLVSDNLIDGILEEKLELEQLICNDALLIALLTLNERERRILNLHLLQKMKFGEVANLLDLKKKTVEKCYERAIKKIRKHFEGENV